jgi:glycosyltransferase involved in cell wall biosynthesis
MRLLFLNHNYRDMGTYYRAMPMAEHLARRGNDVTLMAVSHTQRWRPTWSRVNGVRLCQTPNFGQNNSGEGYGPVDNALRMTHALVNRFDIVHMFDHKPNASFAGLTGRLHGAKLAADWADWWGGPGGINDVSQRRFPVIGRFEAWWEIEHKRRADGVVTISTGLRKRALDAGCPADRVIHIPTGAPTDRIQCMPVSQAREQLGVPLDRRMVGFIGFGQSDLEIVMEALRRLPGVHLMVVGPESAQMLEMARKYDIAERLWQTGRKIGREVSPYLGCADVMVMPMRDTAANRGRLPNKVLDYLAAGRPIVASPVGDVKAIVETYEVGLLAGGDSEPMGFAQAIDVLLANASLREQAGRCARHAAETAYDWSHLIDRLEDFYRSLLQS